MIDLEAFRSDVHAWLAAHTGRRAARLRRHPARPTSSTHGIAWQRRSFDAGFAGIHWPVEHGGRGLTPDAQRRLDRGVRPRRRAAVHQHGRHRARRRGHPAVRHARAAGPTTCARPSRPSGCGASCSASRAPAATSASLSTRAERDGDEFVVNGQKVWCSRRAHQRLGHPHGPHRSRRAASTRASRSSSSTCACPASRSARCGR